MEYSIYADDLPVKDSRIVNFSTIGTIHINEKDLALNFMHYNENTKTMIISLSKTPARIDKQINGTVWILGDASDKLLKSPYSVTGEKSETIYRRGECQTKIES